MNILVAGGAGYLGRALVTSLTQGPHRVRVFDLQEAAPVRGQAGFEYVRGDLLDPQILARALEDIEAVYHLAWSFYPEDHRREVEENVRGTLNLLDGCKASRVRHFIFASTAVVYGPTRQGPVFETEPCHPERSTIGGPVYGITKLACESYSLAWQRGGSAATVMRIHGIFSKDRLGQFSTMIDHATEAREIVAFAEAGGQYAHLDDVVWALCAVLGRDEALGQTFNVAGGRQYRDREIAEYIARKVGAGTKVCLVDDAKQAMISVSIEKLSRCIGYRPRRHDFLRELIGPRLA